MSRPAILDDPALAPILAALPRARLVGGCVRDTLAGRPVADIDLATPDPPDAVMRALRAAGLRAIPTGLSHGTVTAISDGRPFEITTLRRDVTTDGRHAEVAWIDDFVQDAARRDFTINAMSLDQAGMLHDPFGGQADLDAGRVRFVGPAAQRLAEDHLRSLRFFRFYARYGTPPPDPEAANAIAGATAGLAALSAERLWSELKRILATPDPVPVITLMDQLGVLRAVLPEATNLPRLARVVAAGAPPDPLLRLAALLAANPTAVAERLKLSGAEADMLAAFLGQPVPRPEDTEDDLRRLLADTPTKTLIGRSFLAGEATVAWATLRHRLASLPRPIFPLGGRHALALGAHPGPAIGEVLARVRTWWLDGGCHATEAACEARLCQEFGPIASGGTFGRASSP